MPLPADPIGLIYRNKAIFNFFFVKEWVGDLIGHTYMFVVLHAKVHHSLAINLDVRRLAQAFVKIAKVVLRTVAEMHVADRQRCPCRAVFPDEIRKVVHVHDTSVEMKLLQSRYGGSFGKNAPG